MKSLFKLNKFGVIHEYMEHISDFSKEHDVCRDQPHKLLYGLAPLVTKGLSSSMFTGGFLCLFTAKQLKIEDRSILHLQSCPCNVIPSELHPADVRLINTSVALLGQHQSGQRHLLGPVLCVVQWQRILIPFTPFQLGCCRVWS